MNTSEKHPLFVHTGSLLQQYVDDGRKGMDIKLLASAVQSRLIFWSVTLLIMLEDDAAMLAFIFC